MSSNDQNNFKVDPVAVDAYYRHGVPYLLGFNPWEFARLIDSFEREIVFGFFISEVELSNGTYRKYALNWGKICNKYFSYNPEIWEDPIDQCKYVHENSEKLIEELFEGIDAEKEIVDYKNRVIAQLYQATKICIEHLSEEIFKWALTHKFMQSGVSDVILDYDEPKS